MAPVLDFVFPPRCAGCRARAWPLCRDCTAEVGAITRPWCRRCGRPLEVSVSRCRDCPPGAIDIARAPFLYEGPMRRAIQGMKFSGWHALGSHLAGAMAEVAAELRADAVTWVPLSARRQRRRGFDQAEILARHLAPRLDLPVWPMLVRARDTRAQARLSGAERRRSLAGAFRCPASAPLPERILLVDDVLTTGATAAACASALRGVGAGHVAVLTAARSLEGPIPDRCYGTRQLVNGTNRTRVP